MSEKAINETVAAWLGGEHTMLGACTEQPEGAWSTNFVFPSVRFPLPRQFAQFADSYVSIRDVLFRLSCQIRLPILPPKR